MVTASTLPRYVSSKLSCFIEYLGLFGELVLTARTLQSVWGAHSCSQGLILIEVSRDHFEVL